MNRSGLVPSRRRALKFIGAAGVLGASGCAMTATSTNETPVFMDGHVHITNRVYWERIDPWNLSEGGWDYARARGAGVNCIIDNIGTYGYWNYNYSPKQSLRLIEVFHRFAEAHADRMGVALSVSDARRIMASGRMAVFLGVESGFDHEGDLDVLGAMHRLGLRSVQFATQSGFNAFSDSALAPVQGGQKPEHYGGINERGRALVDAMNRLGILIDITHGTEAVHLQIIEVSRAPVVASHETLAAVSGVGLSDRVLKAIAVKGGLVGIHGAAALVGRRYRKWQAENGERAAELGKFSAEMIGHKPSMPRAPGDHGEYIEKMDEEFRKKWLARLPWRDDPRAEALVPSADEWAEHVDYVIKTVGADHVAIGLDFGSGRSAVPSNAGGYGELLAALKRVTTPENVRKIAGENWMRVLSNTKA